MIILEPDGSMQHYPPDRASSHATVIVPGALAEHERRPSIIERIFALTFDILGARSVELKVCEEGQE